MMSETIGYAALAAAVCSVWIVWLGFLWRDAVRGYNANDNGLLAMASFAFIVFVVLGIIILAALLSSDSGNPVTNCQTITIDGIDYAPVDCISTSESE